MQCSYFHLKSQFVDKNPGEFMNIYSTYSSTRTKENAENKDGEAPNFHVRKDRRL